MLETLLNHFRSYGLNDLEFIIVNSKLSHSQERLHELTNRVSFDVFQETEEEEVWNLLEGGKDDMYVYDRCGRLTYYIPFPLSILNETPLVANAILTTYFRSPCGDNCVQNRTLDLEEFVKNLEKDQEPPNVTEEITEAYNGTEFPAMINETYNENYNETNNETIISNDLLSVIDPALEEITSNTSLFSNVTDYDYSEYDSISSVNSTNTTSTNSTTSVEEAKNYFNSIYKMFFHNEKVTEENQETNETVANKTTTSNLYGHLLVDNSTHEHKKHNHEIHDHKSPHSHHKHDLKESKKSDRCLEADYQVCKSWTKKRLLHAQKCCTGKKPDVEIHDPRSCHNFGKKRCKKIQSILKCCIKTVYIEPPSNLRSNETTTSGLKPDTKSEDETEKEQIKSIYDIVCCKTVDNGKLCRVSESENCEDDEYRQSSPIEKDCKDLP